MTKSFRAIDLQLRRIKRLVPSRGYQPRTVYEVTLWGHFAHASDAARAVVTLAEHGHGELANAAARVSFETAISGLWLAIDGEARARQCDRYARRQDSEFMKLLRTLGVRLRVPSDPKLQAILDRTRTDAAGFKAGLGWTQLKLSKQCEHVARHWRTPRALARVRRYASLAAALGNRGSHFGTRDALSRLEAPPLRVRLGPHFWTHVLVGLALQLTAWSYGSLIYVLLRETEVADAAAWHDFFWPLVEQCGKVTGIHA